MEKTYQEYLDDIINGKCSFEDIPKEMLTKEFYNELTENIEMFDFKNIPEDFKTHEMCERAIQVNPELIQYVPNCFLTEEMCRIAVKEYPRYIRFVPENLKNLFL